MILKCLTWNYCPHELFTGYSYFFWAVFDSPKLSVKSKEIILNPGNSIYVSAITFWEISLKYSLGKLELSNISPEALPLISQESGFELLELSAIDSASFYKLPNIKHKDPFDRIIIWQSINNSLILISKDSSLQDYKEFGLRFIW